MRKPLGLLCCLRAVARVSDRGLSDRGRKWWGQREVEGSQRNSGAVILRPWGMHLTCGTREGHVRVDTQISVLLVPRGQQTPHIPNNDISPQPFSTGPSSVTRATCHLSVLLFVEGVIEDECLERGQDRNSGSGVICRWHSPGLLRCNWTAHREGAGGAHGRCLANPWALENRGVPGAQGDGK